MNSILDMLALSENSSVQGIQRTIVSKLFTKGTIIQQRGELSTKSYFVKKGLLRSYTIDAKGKEHIFMFAPEGWIVSDIESQTHASPAELFIDAIEDTEAEIIDRTLMSQIHDLAPEVFVNETNRLLKRIGVLQRRVILLMSAPAEDRYEEFIKTYPQIVQRVPQKMIASYLGITPEALSKIRSKKSK